MTRSGNLPRMAGAMLAVALVWSSEGFADDICPPDADAPAPVEAVEPALVDELIGWIAVNTMYDLSEIYRAPPGISFCDIGEEVPYEHAELIIDPLLGAVYDHTRRQIFLVRPWSPDDRFDVSVLLHELIHDVQLGNRAWGCVGAPEFEAYWLQDKWLSERGVHIAFPWQMIRKLSQCADQ